MNLNRFLITKFCVVAAISFFICGCCSKCSQSSEEDKFAEGYITVVGNEPFAKLALKTDTDQIFLLQLSAELEKKLWGKQGFYYHIAYSDLITNEGVTTIIVKKVSPLNQENKK